MRSTTVTDLFYIDLNEDVQSVFHCPARVRCWQNEELDMNRIEVSACYGLRLELECVLGLKMALTIMFKHTIIGNLQCFNFYVDIQGLRRVPETIRRFTLDFEQFCKIVGQSVEELREKNFFLHTVSRAYSFQNIVEKLPGVPASIQGFCFFSRNPQFYEKNMFFREK